MQSLRSFFRLHPLTPSPARRRRPRCGRRGRSSWWSTRDGDLCTGTAIAHDLVLTAAHCVMRARSATPVKEFQTGHSVAGARDRAPPAFQSAQLRRKPRHRRRRPDQAQPPPARRVVPAALAPRAASRSARRLPSPVSAPPPTSPTRGLGVPRMATLERHRQARLAADPPGRSTTRNARPGLGACTGDSGGPAFDGDARAQRSVIAVMSWTTGRRQHEGCGGLTGLTPLVALPRLDRRHRAQVRPPALRFNPFGNTRSSPRKRGPRAPNKGR